MGRRMDLLVDQIRRAADNEDETTTSGIATEEIVQFLNDAQDKLQALISTKHPNVFVIETTIDIVAMTESYALPTDIYLGNRITYVEFKYGGGGGDYIKLPQRPMDYRYTVSDGDPAYYIRRSGTILLNPVPNVGTVDGIRLNYQRKLKDLDVRRGKILTAEKTGSTLDTLTLNLNSALPKDALLQNQGEAVFNDVDFISIVNKEGDKVLDGIPIDSYDEETGIITISPGFTTTMVPSAFVDQYIVSGRTASSHTELPDMCERFLIAYCVWKLLKRDASVESDEQEDELLSMGQDIVISFGLIDDDIDDIPITHAEWLI